MSFKKTWDADHIIRDLAACTSEVRSAYNDGFLSWGCKQDLYRVKYALNQMLRDTPTFAGEQQYVESLESMQTWEILKQRQ